MKKFLKGKNLKEKRKKKNGGRRMAKKKKIFESILISFRNLSQSGSKFLFLFYFFF